MAGFHRPAVGQWDENGVQGCIPQQEGGTVMKGKMLLPGLFVLGCVLVVFAGCETFPYWPGGSGEPLSEESLAEIPTVESVFPPAAGARFDDIPVPEGMEMNHDRSFVFESEQLQIAYLIYEGRLTPEETAQFFADALPRAGWDLLDVLQYDDITLRFNKPEKNLVVHVSPKTRGCVAKIMLTPRGNEG